MPLVSASLVGHAPIRLFFTKAMETDRLSHAYLFVGEEGLGKTSLAEWLIKSLVGPTGFSHPDVTVLTPAIDPKTGIPVSSIGIDRVREFSATISLTTFFGGWRILFIEEADILTVEAANALLKVLEEPPLKTLFLLRASSVQAIPATIASRCHIMRFHPVPFREIEAWLQEQGISSSETALAVTFSHGCPGRAIRFIHEEAARDRHLQQRELFFQLLSRSPAGRLSSLAAYLQKEKKTGIDAFISLLQSWQMVIREGILEKQESFSSHPPLHWVQLLARTRRGIHALEKYVHPSHVLEDVLLHF